MKNLVIIPARKNSKRIKNKNIIKLLNKPLIYWTIKYAKKLNNKKFDLVVTSDCERIEKILKKEKIFFLKRPKKLSTDLTSMHEVIFHAYNYFKINYRYLVLLQPTSPLRKFDLVHKSIKILDKEKKFDSLIHLAKDQTYSGKILNNKWIPEYSLKTRTQDINNKFKPTGNIFLYRSNLYKNKTNLPKKTFGLISNNSEYLDLDTYEDLKILKFYIKRLKKL